MHYVQILSLLACAQIAMATPISLGTRAKGTANSASQASNPPQNSASSNNKNVTKDSVSRAADNFAQDAGIVSNAINKMTSMTDKAAIKATAQRAFDAESDENNQRQVLAAAAGSAGDSANGKIMKFTPKVLDGLDAITKDASPESVMKNTKMMEDARITQLSNAALNAKGLDQTAPDLKSTTGASGNNSNQSTDRGTGNSGNGGNSGDNNNNNNSGNGNNANDDNSNNKASKNN